jgi:hypothetical protein
VCKFITENTVGSCIPRDTTITKTPPPPTTTTTTTATLILILVQL